MDEDDDDFYGSGHDQNDDATNLKREDNEGDNVERMDVTDDGQASSDDDDDDEDDDSDDGFQITLEKPEGAKANPPAGAKHLLRPINVRTSSGTPDVPQPTGTPSNAPARITSTNTQPVKTESQRPTSAAGSGPAPKGSLTHNGREGKDYPEVRTSSIDVDANPRWGGAPGKPLMEVDIDADLAEHSKPWRLPGTDQTDFFNYGFDEYTWTQYCVRQQAMAGTIAQQKDADAQMKAFFGGGGGGGGGPPGGPGGGGMPGMPPGMPGMPDPAQMMEMMNQGVLPPEFAQMMQMGGMPGMPPFGNGQQGGGQFGGGGGYDGNPNSVSPQPPGQGGFMPPTGPGGGAAQQGFPQMGMEGYSSQQLAIMQDQQGGGGRGGRNRRGGRGGYY